MQQITKFVLLCFHQIIASPKVSFSFHWASSWEKYLFTSAWMLKVLDQLLICFVNLSRCIGKVTVGFRELYTTYEGNTARTELDIWAGCSCKCENRSNKHWMTASTVSLDQLTWCWIMPTKEPLCSMLNLVKQLRLCFISLGWTVCGTRKIFLVLIWKKVPRTLEWKIPFQLWPWTPHRSASYVLSSLSCQSHIKRILKAWQYSRFANFDVCDETVCNS